MELSSGQQRLLFVVVVLALAGLGIFLLGGRHRTAAAADPSPSRRERGARHQPHPRSAGDHAATRRPAAAGVDIYQWLPFTQQDLTAASRATVAFAADYETWTYTEPAQAYVAKMNGLVTTNFAASLQNSYATPGVAALRSAQKQISTSSGGIASIRSFGSRVDHVRGQHRAAAGHHVGHHEQLARSTRSRSSPARPAGKSTTSSWPRRVTIEPQGSSAPSASAASSHCCSACSPCR